MNKPGIQIQHYRKRAGITPAELAALTGIDVYTLIQMEKGNIQPTMDQLIRISAACQVSNDEIFGLQPNPIRQELFRNK